MVSIRRHSGWLFHIAVTLIGVTHGVTQGHTLGHIGDVHTAISWPGCKWGNPADTVWQKIGYNTLTNNFNGCFFSVAFTDMKVW